MTDTHGRGFVLCRRERGETDLFLELLLEDGRRSYAAAKGALHSSRRFSARLSPYTLYQFVFARSLRSWVPRLEEATVEQSYPALLTDLRRLAAAGAASAVARDFSGEVSIDAAPFDLYAALLESLQGTDADGSGAALVRFSLAMATRAGHPIVMDACVRCGRQAPDNALVCFNPAAGGVVCARCGGGPFVMRAAERRALLALARGEATTFDASALSWLSAMIEPYARRGAEAIATVVGHWASRP